MMKIALIGPESSGKTTLAEQLAGHYKTTWVPEFARGYIQNLGRSYNKADILYCAKRQLEQESEGLKKANKYFFADTEIINNKVWLKDVFDEEDEWIQKNIDENAYDFYLLLYPDLPFVDDPVRENPHRRKFFFNWYKQELDELNIPYAIIRGTGEERLRNAISEIEKAKLSVH